MDYVIEAFNKAKNEWTPYGGEIEAVKVDPLDHSISNYLCGVGAGKKVHRTGHVWKVQVDGNVLAVHCPLVKQNTEYAVSVVYMEVRHQFNVAMNDNYATFHRRMDNALAEVFLSYVKGQRGSKC